VPTRDKQVIVPSERAAENRNLLGDSAADSGTRMCYKTSTLHEHGGGDSCGVCPWGAGAAPHMWVLRWVVHAFNRRVDSLRYDINVCELRKTPRWSNPDSAP
jgi:hypothetical protein